MPKTRVTCPTCATPLELDDEYLGQEVQCGSCHQVFEAKAEKRRRPRDDEDGPMALRSSKFRREVEDDEDDDYRPRRRRRSGSGSGGGAATASLVLGLIAIIAWCCPLIGFPVTVAGLICGCIGLKSQNNKGAAIAGLILNGLFLVATIANSALGAAMNLGAFNNRFNRNNNPWNQQQNPPPWNPPPAQPRNFR
jgi:predicted Zn finger-like uncharacterized protein